RRPEPQPEPLVRRRPIEPVRVEAPVRAPERVEIAREPADAAAEADGAHEVQAERADAPVEPASPPADKSDVRRALDDLEAAKERLARDARRAEDATRLRLVGELLPVLDNLDRTVGAGSADRALLEGVTLVRDQLERVLAGYGLERIEALHRPFDPALHEAVAVAPVDDPALDGVVVDELARGYRVGDRVQRPAVVRVGKLAA
ncbi:MAG TPA: nucleotide exchange factor GrpE, partial [Minicystis sp.]|nr:nucleotide exchange factor GrpE [Minicystis sp.]